MRPIILADPQDLTRLGFRSILPQDATIEDAFDKKALLHALNEAANAWIVLDYTRFDFTGVDDLLVVQARYSKSIWLLVCDELSDGFVRQLLFSSTHFGILYKDASIQETKMAYRAAEKGERYICTRAASQLKMQSSQAADAAAFRLTHTEREILMRIALGKSTKEIASERFSSIHTITTHRKNIFRKIGVNSVHEATRYALRAGLIDQADYYI
jgi:DNA-binding NarL/FixJ family response regulator